MKHQYVKYAASFLGVGIIVLLAFFLPQNYSKWQDEEYLNQLTTEERERSAISTQYDISREKKLEILMASAKKGEEFRPVLQKDAVIVNLEKMLNNISVQFNELAAWMAIPGNDSEIFSDYVYADLYSVNSTGTADTSADSVLYWVVRFTDYATYDVLICADAYDYTIYNIKVTGTEVAMYNIDNISSVGSGSNLIMQDSYTDGIIGYYDASNGYITSLSFYGADYQLLSPAGLKYTVKRRYDQEGQSIWMPEFPTFSLGISTVQEWMYLAYSG